MTPFTWKALALSLIVLGELLIISAEMYGARNYGSATTRTLMETLPPLLFIMIVGVVLLVIGYMIGYRSFQNIWIVTATSIASVLLIEPTMSFLLFHQLPTRGALIGLVFGVCGMASALFL